MSEPNQQAPAPTPSPTPAPAPTTTAAQLDLVAELSRLRTELAEAKGAQSQAAAQAAAAELAEARSFRAATEERIRQDAIKAHLPQGLPPKAADLIVLGISSKLGAFEVDVAAWTAKDTKAIKDAIAKEDLAGLVTTTEGGKPNPSIMPPRITTAPAAPQRSPNAPLHVAGERPQAADPRADALLSMLAKALTK